MCVCVCLCVILHTDKWFQDLTNSTSSPMKGCSRIGASPPERLGVAGLNPLPICSWHILQP